MQDPVQDVADTGAVGEADMAVGEEREAESYEDAVVLPAAPEGVLEGSAAAGARVQSLSKARLPHC